MVPTQRHFIPRPRLRHSSRSMSSNALADLLEGEGSQWKTLCCVALGAIGKPPYRGKRDILRNMDLVALAGLPSDPLDMKAEANLHFPAGHQSVDRPWLALYRRRGGYPGWSFYAAGAFNEKNPWWIVMPDVMRYLQRASFMLRQGRPVE